MKLEVCCEEYEVGNAPVLIKGLVGLTDGLGVDRLDLAKALAGNGSTIQVQLGVKNAGFPDAAMDDVLDVMATSHDELLKNLKAEIVSRLERVSEPK